MKLAIFDLDGTLIPGSSERQFFRYLARNGRQGPRQVAAFAAFAVRYFPRYRRLILKKNKAYLAGLGTDDVEACAHAFVREILVPDLRSPMLERLRAHQRDGDHVALLSGTLDRVVESLAAELGVTTAAGTRCAERDGIFLALPPECHPFAAAKLTIARQIAESLGFALTDVVAYADAVSDVPLLEAVGHAVAVSPDTELLAEAGRRGWEILMAGKGGEATGTTSPPKSAV